MTYGGWGYPGGKADLSAAYAGAMAGYAGAAAELAASAQEYQWGYLPFGFTKGI